MLSAAVVSLEATLKSRLEIKYLPLNEFELKGRRTVVKLYGYKKCGTCRKAEKALQALNVDYTFIDITVTPPSATTIKNVAKQAQLEMKKMFNTSGVQYRELKIKDQLPQLTDKDIVSMLAENGRLIKRPIVTDGSTSSVGFKEETFLETWKTA